MRKRTGRRRLVRGVGAFLSATLIAGSAAIVLGGGVASAATANWSVIGNPTSLAQNTQGNETTNNGVITGASGASAALQFDVPSWTAGQTIAITVAPNDSGHPGKQCSTNPQPEGVNQSDPQAGNYVGFADFREVSEEGTDNGVFPPLVVSDGVVTAGEGGGPLFDFDLAGPISCSTANPLGDDPSEADGSFTTLVLTFLNSGVNGHVQLGNGIGQEPAPQAAGPIILDIGFGAATGPVHFFVSDNGGSAFSIPSAANVVGQTPMANNPPSHLTRNTITDAVNGPISEFSITEVGNMLPPSDGTPPANPMGPNQFLNNNNEWTHNLRASVPGGVCLVMDNGQGNDLEFTLGTNGWSVQNNAGTAGFSATAGSAVVNSGGNSVYLPVTTKSNGPATWTTTGLGITGTAYADGPVYAWVYWLEQMAPVQGGTNCPSPPQIANGFPAYLLGYVQVATISELANAIFGANAEATAAQAIDHQFDSAKGTCVSNTVGPDFFFGPSIFLARSDLAGDALGAAYAAGTVNSGVLLTPTNSLDNLTRTQIRLQGVATVFVVGGPLAISDAVVQQLQNTQSFLCGGTQPRTDGNNNPAMLNVIRIAGETLYDTNAELATFVGAEPPAAFGAFGATNQFNSTSGMSTAGVAPAFPVNTALLVTGENFQDAMVASVPAYGGDFISNIGQTGPMPLIATTGASLSPQAVASIFNQHIGQVLVIGGPLAVSDNVMNQLAALGVYAIRIAGADNTETSTQLASFELSPSLGFGYLNWDFDWDAYVDRTAGLINQNNNRQVSARVVLMARGDVPFDAMAAAAVLSVHNGRFENPQKFPLITTVNPDTLGAAVTAFLQNASLPISALVGSVPADGRDDQPGISSPAGDDCVNRSSSVFTIQPVGGPLALSNALRAQAVGLIGSTALTPMPGITDGCGEVQALNEIGG